MHDISFLHELGDTDMGRVAQYEIAQMYDLPLDDIQKLVKSREQ